MLAERLGDRAAHGASRRRPAPQDGLPDDAAKGPDGGYRLEAGAELPPLLFDDEQVLALTAALRAPIAGLEEASARALATVRQVLPARLRLERMRCASRSRRRRPSQSPERLVAVAAAVRASEVLRFAYAEAVRRVEPHHLVARQGRWYLIGFDLDRDDWRVFRVDRLEPRSPRGARFRRRALPVRSPAEFLEARFRGGAPGEGWPCRGSVVLEAPAAEVLPYAGDGEVEDLGDAGCRLALGAWRGGATPRVVRPVRQLRWPGPSRPSWPPRSACSRSGTPRREPDRTAAAVRRRYFTEYRALPVLPSAVVTVSVQQVPRFAGTIHAFT